MSKTAYLNIHIDTETMKADRASIHTMGPKDLTAERGWATVFTLRASDCDKAMADLRALVELHPHFAWIKPLLGPS